MAQSEFAMRMLEKQGWKEGEGLGKNRDGISKPIRAFIKRDKAGVGQDIGANLTDHWWLRVFNDAAKSNVTKTVEVTEEKQNPSLQNRLYAGFRKGSTLKQGKEEKDSDCSSEDDMEKNLNTSDVPTLDDIHKYCGGATGHRAATLGIKMTGKLQRAAEHERLFDEREKDKEDPKAKCDDESNGTGTQSTSMKRKKKKKDKNRAGNVTTESTSSKNSMDDTCSESPLSIYEQSDLVSCEDVNVSFNTHVEKVERKKSKKSKREREEQAEDTKLSDLHLGDKCITKRRKKSGSNQDHAKSIESSESLDNKTFTEKSKKKKKKKKLKD